jgi:hypothetical protein
MKLTNILREIEGEEDGMSQLKVNYDLAVQPKDIDAALEAMDNISNYGIYAQNMRDPQAIEKIFGPSNPGKKSVAAQSNWDSLSPEAKLLKIEEIKDQLEFFQGKTINIGKAIFFKVKNVLDKNKEYLKWSEENGDNPEEYLSTLNGKQASDIGIFGSRGSAYYPQRTPDNLKKYGGKLEKDIHYIVKDGKIVFPYTLENPYKTKPYLSKVLKTIMDNAGVEFELIDVEQGAEKPVAVQKPEKEVIPPLTYTADTKDKAEKARTAFQKEIGEVPTVKYEIEAVDSPEGRKYKLTVTGFQNPDQRAKLFTRKTTLKEEQEFDLERYQMLRRAGIIK